MILLLGKDWVCHQRTKTPQFFLCHDAFELFVPEKSRLVDFFSVDLIYAGAENLKLSICRRTANLRLNSAPASLESRSAAKHVASCFRMDERYRGNGPRTLV
jgi:hypothetical protein